MEDPDHLDHQGRTTVDKGIENLLARLHRDLVTNLRITPAAIGSSAAMDTEIRRALLGSYEAGRAEVLRDQAPCDGVVRPPGTEDNRAAKCMKLAGHAAPHESADGCQWWSGADGSVLAALSRSEDDGSTSESGAVVDQTASEGA